MTKEQKLLEHLESLSPDQIADIKGKPEKVVELIDNFHANSSEPFNMNIGHKEGQLVIEEMSKVKPKIMIEVGGYMGYSAILFGKEVAKNGGKYFSFEYNPDFAAIARKFIDLAGLSDVVTVIVGASKHTLPKLPELLQESGIPYNAARPVDFILLDHEKSLYIPDFRLLETINMIGIGTVIAADNILFPMTYPYHEYMALSPQEKNAYNDEHENVEGKNYVGRWNMAYETRLVKYNDRDGMEISKCVSYFDA